MTPRRAVPDDVPAIARLFRRARAVRTPWLPVLHTPAEDLAFFAQVLTASEVWVVGDPAQAFVGVRPGWVDHLYVDPDVFGRGVGGALLGLALADGAEQSLWCFQRNTIARAFYERRGFRLVRLTPGDNEEGEPDALYRRPAIA